MAEFDKNSWFIPLVHTSLTQDEVKEVTDDLNFHCAPKLLEAITAYGAAAFESLDILDNLNGYLPEVKYPRTPGRKPGPDENPGNAWAWLCDIPGASEGKLSGKKVAIKDNVAVAGVPMSNGSLVLEGYVPEYDAPIVTRILDAGGKITGKAACDDFCSTSMGYSSIDKYIHLPQTPHLRVGGSSGGSAVLVATGDVDLAIGGDQGGSIRVPASWSGVVGLKATHGLIPYTGAISVEPTLDHVGPIARNVTDCALFLEVLAGNDGVDHRQNANITVSEYSKQLEDKISFKLGVLKEGFETSEKDVQDLTKAFMDKVFIADNLTRVDVSAPLHKQAVAIFLPITLQGGKNTLFQGTTPQFIGGFQSTSLQKAVEQGVKYNSRMFSPHTKQIVILAEVCNRRYGIHYYTKAQNLVIELRQQIDAALSECDVLVMPTLTRLPTPTVLKTGDEAKDYRKYIEEGSYMSDNTRVFNMTGHPALTIPLGKPGDPSKPGFMIVGRKYDELTVLQVGRALETIVHASLL